MVISNLPVFYPDTNLLVYLCKNTRSIPRFGEYLNDKEPLLGISSVQALELSPSGHVMSELERTLSIAPSYFLKDNDIIREEEIKAYPKRRCDSLLMQSLDDVCRNHELGEVLQNEAVAHCRNLQVTRSKRLAAHITILREQFEKAEGSQHTASKGALFARLYTDQEVGMTYPQFMMAFKDPASEFDARLIASEYVLGLVIYYRYYLHRKNIVETDLGDLLQVSVYPYCSVLVLESQMTDELRHIQRDHPVLDGIEIIKFSEFRQEVGI